MAEADIHAPWTFDQEKPDAFTTHGRVGRYPLHFVELPIGSGYTHCRQSPILRTQIHAGHVYYVKRAVRMLLVVPLHRLLQLRHRAQISFALQLLLALAAGENGLAVPWSGVGLRFLCHPAQLDAVFP